MDHFGGVSECFLSDRAAEHASDFLDTFVIIELSNLALSAVMHDRFTDLEVEVSVAGDASEVSDAEDLVAFADFSQHLSDVRGGLSADASIDFVEDVTGDVIFFDDGAFDGEEDAGEFAAGGNFREGARVFAGVWAEREADVVGASIFEMFKVAGGVALDVKGGMFHGEEV